ncbi:hypothetical protein PInf_008126 [Phytophthora infestans]|nr:hypothetical protein PInf_007941 [Phytophthora infestans]KAI9982231.1 hypothetical protein PInf_008126 [Phytophthora infestans]
MMRLVAIAAGLLASIHAEKLAYNSVVPMPETEATTNELSLALRFKPQLHVDSGCHPYPAVDEDGNINSGLALYSFKKCGPPALGSQTYGRATTYKDSYAIMYSWYFPRELRAAFGHRHSWENIIVWVERKTGGASKAKMSAVSSSINDGQYFTIIPPTEDMMDDDSVKIQYRAKAFSHYVNVTTVSGDFQDLVMWNDMPSAARTALDLYDFGKATVPFKEDTFVDNLKMAYPCAEYATCRQLAVVTLCQAINQLDRYSKSTANRIVSGLTRIAAACREDIHPIANELMEPLLPAMLDGSQWGKFLRLRTEAIATVLVGCAESDDFRVENHPWISDFISFLLDPVVSSESQ